MMRYRIVRHIRRHWRGECSLKLAFWCNFALPFCLLTAAERFTRPPFLHGETTVTFAAVVFFVAARLVVYPWQVVGVLRACERRLATRGNRGWVGAAQGVVVLSFVVVLAAAFANYQAVLGYKESLRAAENTNADADRGYRLTLVRDDTLLHLRGRLAPGITAEVARLLAAHPRITGIILDSGGGRVAEGRGLARLIRERALATYTLADCVSACTTAFIAGAHRGLGANARLGFHQYQAHSVLPAFDIAAEQTRDRAAFAAQGIAPAFLRRMFARPPDAMWWPNETELRAAGVVHATGFRLQ